jgi:hypothetical protein
MKSGSKLSLSFQGSKVFLVMKPGIEGTPSRVTITLDGVPMSQEVSGKDVRNSQVVVDEDRLYELVDFKGQNTKATIRIIFDGGDMAVYAFTFA